MSVRLDPLYHWAPKRHRRSILRDGLKIMTPCRPFANGETIAFPWVCLGTTPSSAWGLILDAESEMPDEGGEGWDLWQVALSDTDRLKIRGDFAPYVREVRVENGIPADRIWWVAERLGLSPRDTIFPRS